jgi:hypothetical protein
MVGTSGRAHWLVLWSWDWLVVSKLIWYMLLPYKRCIDATKTLDAGYYTPISMRSPGY